MIVLGLGREEVAGACFESGWCPAFSAGVLFWNCYMHSGSYRGCYIPMSLGQASSPRLAGWVCTLDGTNTTDTLVEAHSPSYS